MTSKTEPIFGLIGILDSDPATEIARFLAKCAGVTTLGDLVKFPRKEFEDEGVDSGTLDALEQTLKDKYDLELASDPQTDYPEIVSGNIKIVDQGDSLVVNGVKVTISTKPNALPKDKVIEVYKVYGTGAKNPEIGKRAECSIATVYNHLAKARLSPHGARKKTSVPSTTSKASGAPPPSLYSNKPSLKVSVLADLIGY